MDKEFLKAQKARLQAIIYPPQSKRNPLDSLREPIISRSSVDLASYLSDLDNTVLMLNRDAMDKVLARVAASKINDGTYGVCSGCEGEILLKRLIAHPQAILCASCQERSEAANVAPTVFNLAEYEQGIYSNTH